MIIVTKSGRKKSILTPKEIEERAGDVISALSPHERELLFGMLDDAEEEQVDVVETMIEHRYHTQPVTMEQFIEDPYYLGESCTTIYPELKKDLIELFDFPYREAVLTGAIGVGKTFAMSIAICRVLYELSCLVNPQKTFGLSSGTEMVIPWISKNLTLAREVMKTAVDDKIRESVYFMEKFAPKISKESTVFPKNIRVIVGSYGSERVLGSNTFSAALDETNFPPNRKAQQITTRIGQRKTAAHFDPVEKVYRNLLRRIKSRFQKAGGDFPGMVMLASSAATLESFTERKMKESANDPHVFVRDHTAWTVKPGTEFCGEKFWVICSTSSIQSRILREDEYDLVTDEYLEENDAWLIDVPIEFLSDFETDIENAMRDIAGISTQALSKFIQRVDTVDDCADDSIPHAFSMGEWTAGGPGHFLWDVLCKKFERRLPGGYIETGYSPRINPKALRWCHIDTSLSGDATGFCVGHIDRWVEVVRRDGQNNHFVDEAPFYIIDVLLRINPPPGEQIYLPDLRTLVYQLIQHGYKFMGFSSDSYQYAETHQQLERRGIHCELISMDITTEPYDEVKRAMYENRMRYHRYEPFIEEMKALEYDRLVGKIDHPQAGCFVGSTRVPLLDGSCPTIEELEGKDVWVYSCTENGHIVPGRGCGRRTKYISELVDIVLDSGAVERCTPEHLWMLRDGSYKEAKDLVPGVDRLMPINRIWPVNGGYERVTDSHATRTLIHYLVWEYLNGPIASDECIHHLNGVKVDNSPYNLKPEKLKEHARRHTYERHQNDREYHKAVTDGLKRFNCSERGRKIHREALIKTNRSRTKESHMEVARKRSSFRRDIHLSKLYAVKGEETANGAARALGCGRNVIMRVLRENGFSTWSEFRLSESGNNHKVRYVIPVKLAVSVPVYDLEVDVFSNFALSSGVFVHNSKDVADSAGGVIHGLLKGSTSLPIGLQAATPKVSGHEHSWVSSMVPASQVDVSEVREMAEEAQDDMEYLPIIYGD